MAYRLGVDVGGTFTDILLIDEESGATYRAKTSSTPEDQSIGVLRGIERACEHAQVTLADIDEVFHGTTVATNAILEGKGATVGLVTTKGFRQVLQIARSYVPGGLAGWIIWPKPEPLAALENTVEVDERIASDGTVIRALDDDDARAQLTALKGRDIQALAVSLINSFADPAHEPGDGDARQPPRPSRDPDGRAEQQRGAEHREERGRLVHRPERPGAEGDGGDGEEHVDEGVGGAAGGHQVASRFARLRWRSSR